jgi:hypothetical protein
MLKELVTFAPITSEGYGSSLLFLDGNTINNLSKEEISQFNKLRRQGYIIVIDHPDLLITRDAKKILIKQLESVDFAVIHNPNLDLPSNLASRVLLWPTFPFPDFLGRLIHRERESALLFSGGMHRGNRMVYYSYLKKRGINVVNQLYPTKEASSTDIQSRGDGFTSYLGYLDMMQRYQMAFTNGYRNPKESLMAFRVCELMLKGVLCFYEEGSWINFFFNPYTHYIPVDNAPDLLSKVRYFNQNPQEIVPIVTSAREIMNKQYSSEIFWKSLNYMIYR